MSANDQYITYPNFRIGDCQIEIDEKLTKEIDKLQQAYKKSPVLPSDAEKRAWEQFKIAQVYSTCALEGNTFSYSETEMLLKGITVAGKKVEEMQDVLNQAKIIGLMKKWLRAPKNPFTEEKICALHQVVGEDIIRTPGQYRTTPVLIGGSKYRPAEDRKSIKKLMSNYVTDVNKAEFSEKHISNQATLVHFGLAIIQPFYDGNKRTARVLQNLWLMRQKFPPVVIPIERLIEYRQALVQGYEKLNVGTLGKLIAQEMIKTLNEQLYLRNGSKA